MNFDDPGFLGFACAAAAAFHLVAEPRWRRCVLLAASGAFVASFGTGLDLWRVVLFVLAAATSVLAAAARRRTALPLLALLVTLFAVLKGYLPFVAPSHEGAVVVGMSYVLFRTVQVLVDLSEGALEGSDVAPLDLLLFLASFLTFVAGPIQRYESFRAQLVSSRRVTLAEIDPRAVFGRTVLGYVKLLTVAPALLVAHGKIVEAAGLSGVRVGLAASVFALWVYVNFSGYMDVVVGIGRLFGFELPENFDRPDRAVSFLDLWTRWHITLSRTFLTYVFNPLLRLLLGHGIASGTAGALGYLTVFFLIGWWHQPGAAFALSGLLLGLAAVVNKVWQNARRGGVLHGGPWRGGTLVSGGLGLGAFAVAIIPTWPLFTSATEALQALGSPIEFTVTLVTASTIGVLVRFAGVAADHVQIRWRWTWPELSRLATSAPVVGGLAALLVWLALEHSLEFSAIVYYQRF